MDIVYQCFTELRAWTPQSKEDTSSRALAQKDR